MAFTAGAVILCNGNTFKPESDDLVQECTRIAKKVGMASFVIRIDGHTYNSAAELPTNSVKALIKNAEVVEEVAEVRTAQDVAA